MKCTFYIFYDGACASTRLNDADSLPVSGITPYLQYSSSYLAFRCPYVDHNRTILSAYNPRMQCVPLYTLLSLSVDAKRQ